jgi:hypothetical protein
MARDANGEVWVERGGQLTALNRTGRSGSTPCG